MEETDQQCLAPLLVYPAVLTKRGVAVSISHRPKERKYWYFNYGQPGDAALSGEAQIEHARGISIEEIGGRRVKFGPDEQPTIAHR